MAISALEENKIGKGARNVGGYSGEVTHLNMW